MHPPIIGDEKQKVQFFITMYDRSSQTTDIDTARQETKVI